MRNLLTEHMNFCLLQQGDCDDDSDCAGMTLSALNVVTVKMCLAVLATRQDTQVVVGKTTAIQTRMQHGFDYLSDKF